jgi:polysaccharide export outer membrane protein
MSSNCLPRARWRVAIPGLLALLSACATRHPESIAPVVPVAANTVWRIESGDLIRTKVYREPELSSDATVSPGGTAFFPGLGRVAVAGLSVDSVEALLNARYGQLLREPAVQVVLQRDITIQGQVRSPGVYGVDPNGTLQGLIARAGGPSNANASPEIVLETADGRRLLIPREVRMGTIELSRRDAISLSDQSFITRNNSTISAASLVVSLLSTIISLVVIVSR